jgi:hypothetical protein
LFGLHDADPALSSNIERSMALFVVGHAIGE